MEKMKKAVSLILITGTCLLAQGQLPIATTDTIVGRADHLYYLPYWYDQCQFYQDDTVRFKCMDVTQFDYMATERFDYVVAEEHYALQPILVRGLAAMVSKNCRGGTFALSPTNPRRGAEKLYLMLGDSLHPTLPDFYYPLYMHCLDSVRWDTAAPKLMRMPMNQFATPSDTSEYLECYLYEAMFGTPYKVRDTFYVIGTFHSNIYDTTSNPLSPFVFHNIPTVYTAVKPLNTGCDRCAEGTRLFVSETLAPADWSVWMLYNHRDFTTGPFLPIIFSYSLEASASPAAGGTVEGTGRFPELWVVPLTAVPDEGYVFSHWSDGSTDNPRQIELTTDTVLTAVFQAR